MIKCLWCGQSQSLFEQLSFFCSFQPAPKNKFCKTCWEHFIEISEEKKCIGCAKSMDKENEYCLDCQLWLRRYSKDLITHQALFQYNDRAKELMKQFKYQGDYALAHGFTDLLRETLRKNYSEFTVCPIPSTLASFSKRGFVPTECLLCTAQIPYNSSLLNNGQGRQANRNRKERLNISQPFELVKNENLPSKILLFDDVYTTGRTLLHAKELLASQGVQVQSLTLFR